MKLRLLPATALSAVIPLLAPSLLAQSTPAPLYVESFRQGPTRVVEEKFDVQLTPQAPIYRERIKDSHGDDRYALSIVPQGPEGDTEITSWQVKLADLRYSIYDNVLQVSQEPSSDLQNALWRLKPTSFSRVPFGARRIIKVESFYVVLQVKAYHFTPLDSPYLDSMTLALAFSNTDPRTTKGNPQ